MGKFFEKFFMALRNILLAIREFIDSLIGDNQESPSQTLEREEKRDVARPVELGISSHDQPAYKKKQYVITYREKVLLESLRQAVEDKYTILMKVRMGDFITLRNEPENRKFHENQIMCKHVDFLLCSRNNIEPILVIELDDSSHKIYYNAERDRFKDETFRAIGLPFIRMKVQEKYDPTELRKQIQERISFISQ